MNYLIGIDLGTTRLKAVLISEEGKIISQSSSEYPIEQPYPGWTEQDPHLWWKKTKECIAEILQKSKIKSKDIKGIGLSGQMLGIVTIDKYYKLIRPAIIWADQRTISQCGTIRDKMGEDGIYRITGNPIVTGYTLPLLLWIKENESKNYKKIYKFMLCKDFLRLKLTGKVVTEPTDASGTLLFDTFNRNWSEKILSEFKIEDSLLPSLCDSLTISGELTAEAAKELRLSPGIPVAGGGGDQLTGAVGIGLINPGTIVSTIATGGQVNTCVDRPITDFERKRLHTFCHIIPDRWLLDSGTLTAGESLRWFRDNFGNFKNYGNRFANKNSFELLCKEAENVSIGSDGLIFLPYLSGEHTPHMDPYAKGTFTGIRRSNTRAHFIRAILEGVVYSLRDCIEVYHELNLPVNMVISAGGGAKSSLWRQIQSDVFGKDLWTCNIEDHSPFGAAVIAGVAIGVFKDIESSCRSFVRYKRSNKCVKENFKRYNKRYQIYKKIYKALKDIFVELEE